MCLSSGLLQLLQFLNTPLWKCFRLWQGEWEGGEWLWWEGKISMDQQNTTMWPTSYHCQNADSRSNKTWSLLFLLSLLQESRFFSVATEGIPVECHVLLLGEFWPWRTEAGSHCARCKWLILSNWDLNQMHKPSSAVEDAPWQKVKEIPLRVQNTLFLLLWWRSRDRQEKIILHNLFMKGYPLLSSHRVPSCSAFLQLILLLAATATPKWRLSQEK